MVSTKKREQLIVELVQSYRLTGQLFFKLLQTAMQEQSAPSRACLPILKVLKHRGSMSQSAIARELYHSDAAVSRQIGILVEDGLVSAKPDATNRRATLVELTDKGNNLFEELETTVTGFLTDVLAEMSDSELRQSIDSNIKLQQVVTAKIGKEPRA